MLYVEMSNIPPWCLMGLRFMVIQGELQQKQLFINEIQLKSWPHIFIARTEVYQLTFCNPTMSCLILNSGN